MRIRKHAKNSPLLAANSSLQTHVICQLNQSPWDVITFPVQQNEDPKTPHFSFYQFDNNGYVDNETFSDSNATVERVTSMKLDDKREMNEIINYSKWDYYDNVTEEQPGDNFVKYENDEDVEIIHEELGLLDNNNTTIKCCKTDGKKWQCSKEAKEGYNLCEHHIAKLSSTNKPKKQQEAAVVENSGPGRGRPRVKKSLSSSSSSSNPYEFYYYSGFGPSWGKKRGHGKANHATKDVEHVQSMDEFSNDSQLTQSSSSQMDNIQEIDYVEDEEYEDDDDEEKNGKKRARKPIKARSLKSLM